ncbi:MAG: ThiF family adenylyltransferase [Solirubrobacteraceae bacterium]
MSHTLVSRSPDLRRLQQDGYDIAVEGVHLLLRDVPFLDQSGEVARGTLVSALTTTGTTTAPNPEHTAYLVGGVPHNDVGAPLTDELICTPNRIQLGTELFADCQLSRKPPNGYGDYYTKMVGYADYLETWARRVDPTATARVYRPMRSPPDDDSVFEYFDSASSRAQISHLSERLALQRVAIVGLGGTGSYILDQVAKTRVREIHLYDSDVLYAHNAFRAPGAVTADQLDEVPLKVDYYRDMYAAMHRHITAHPVDVTAENAAELTEMTFVFLAMDPGENKRVIVDALEQSQVQFIEVGLGAKETGAGLQSMVRTVTSVPAYRELVRGRIWLEPLPDDEYDRNIQIADLNALNAMLAIIRWKKLYGFYADTGHEHSSALIVERNKIINDDIVDA